MIEGDYLADFANPSDPPAQVRQQRKFDRTQAIKQEKQRLRDLKAEYRAARADERERILDLAQKIAASKARIKLLKVRGRSEKLRERTNMGRM
jgi:hypothetical protein